MKKKDPPILQVSIYVNPEIFPIIQSVLERERDGFPQRIYGVLKPYLPHLQQVFCSLSQGEGWEIIYPLAPGMGNCVTPSFLGYSIDLGLPGISSKKASETIKRMNEEGAPFAHRILHLAGVSDTSKYYQLGISDETVTAYCQVRSRLYWAGKLTPEEWTLISEVEETGIDLNPQFERSISEALDRSIDGFGIWEVA